MINGIIHSGQQIVTNGLVLHLDAAQLRSYPTIGTTWTDLSGNGYDGTLTNGPTFNSGNGGSIVFDGANDFVNTNASINTGQDFTFGVWLRPTAVGLIRRCIMANAQNWPNIDAGWYFVVGQGGGNNRFFISIGADNAAAVSVNNAVTTGVWQYLVATVASGGLFINLYKNGIIQSQSITVLSQRTINYSRQFYYIARRDPTSVNDSDFYTGNLGQIVIYNRALSATEVLQNYNATKSRYGL